jgi:hypothetical protein
MTNENERITNGFERYHGMMRIIEKNPWNLDARDVCVGAQFSNGSLFVSGMPNGGTRVPVLD